MVAPLRHVSTPELAGSWPIIPNFLPSGVPTILPDTILTNATILGVRQETDAGYDVESKTFRLYVDNDLSYTTVTWGVVGNQSLDQVIAAINSQTGVTVAFRDNGFLKLKSPTSGEGSYLRVESSSITSDVLYVLGLFPGTISKSGDLNQAGHPDPSRQVSLPGQLTWAEGESFSTRSLNRALFQLGVNAERNEGLLSRKRLASSTKVDDHAYSSPATREGYQFSGGTFVYVGPDLTPTSAELEKLFVVLDSSGREFVKEYEDVHNTNNLKFYIDNETGQQLAGTVGIPFPPFIFTANDPKNDVYVACDNAALDPYGLRNVPMKIISYIGAAVVAIAPINPTTGESVEFTEGILTGLTGSRRFTMTTTKCVVERVIKSETDTTRVEGLEEVKYSGSLSSSSRVDRNNRLVVPGAGFLGLTPALDVGDVVEWTLHGVTSPFSNNGTYRLSAVIDDDTIELVAEDWGPVILNPDLYSATPGDLEIRTDGKFWKDPFIEFKDPPDGSIPEDGVDQIRILYKGMSTFREATDNPTAFGSSLEFSQETDDTVQEALLAIMGPSVQTIDEYLHGDRRKNIEDLDYRLNFEHYSHDETHDPFSTSVEQTGRHRDIRPDTIDMFPDNAGTTVTVRADPGDSINQTKVELKDPSDEQVFEIRANGETYVRHTDDPIQLYTRIGAGFVWASNTYDDSGAYARVQTTILNSDAQLSVFAGLSDSVGLIKSGTGNAQLTIEVDDVGDSTLGVDTDDGEALFYLRSLGDDHNALAEISGKGNTNSKAILKLEAGFAGGDTGVGEDYGGPIIKIISDANAVIGTGPAQFNIAAKRAAGGPQINFDWVNNGEGSTYKSLRLSSSGPVSIGDDVQDDLASSWINLFVKGESGQPRVYDVTGSGYIIHPTLLIGLDEGHSGVSVVVDNADLDSFPDDAGFACYYPHDDLSSNNDRTWKAFKLVVGAGGSIGERFSVNKEGQVFCGLDNDNQSSVFASKVADSTLRNNIGVWARQSALIGSLDNWDGFATTGTYIGSAALWLAGGAGMGDDQGPYSIHQGISNETRYAHLYNCYFSPTVLKWRYVTDEDYAVRMWTRGGSPGVSEYGHTQWSASPPSTGAGDEISTGTGNGSWIHSLYWDHETGFIGIGLEGSVPAEALTIHQDSATVGATISLDQDGDGPCSVLLDTDSSSTDPFISIDANGTLFAIGVDNSKDYFRIQPGVGPFTAFSGDSGISVNANGNVGIQDDPDDSWSVIVGDDTGGSVYTGGKVRVGGDLGATGVVRTNDSGVDGFQFGTYSQAQDRTFYTFQSPTHFYWPRSGTPSANNDMQWGSVTQATATLWLSDTGYGDGWVYSPLIVPTHDVGVSGLILDEIRIELWRDSSTSSTRYAGNLGRRVWDTPSPTWDIETPVSLSSTSSGYVTLIFDLATVGHAIVSQSIYTMALRYEFTSSGNQVAGTPDGAMHYGRIIGIRARWITTALRPGIGF